jgi:hypothetical protein
MTARKAPAAPAAPVANLASARKEQAQMRREAAAAKQRHPAGKQAAPKPAAKAPAKKPAPAKAPAKPAPAVEAEKFSYQATARSGKVNSRTSATPMVAALDVKIAGRKGAQFAAGVVVGFYASRDKAQAAADEINAGKVADWSDAIVVSVAPFATSKAV